MKKIFIKYNPYQVTTEIVVDEKPVKANSELNKPQGCRLQEWIDDLPRILFDEFRTKEFDITFHGTMLDYEDLEDIVEDARRNGFSVNLTHNPAKESKDKEKVIDEIFKDIQNGPYDELRDPDVKKSFENARSSNFEVNVVATMSAGKSTLINSLLQQKLMPAKQEACTATITEIKDNDSKCYTAVAYGVDEERIETHKELTYEIMKELNENAAVSRICIEGDIPFVEADAESLVLVDTPGPNNSRDPEHQKATYRMLSESSKTLVLYILNATQLQVNDDNILLKYVANSMKVGGKQSRDRFLFVVNKLDDFKRDEDSVKDSLEKIIKYLEGHEITNPNIYPASALTALEIRTVLAESDDDDDESVYDAKGRVRKFCNREELHFENYAPLPASVRARITKRLASAKEVGDKKEQALIHSGIPSIEEAIRMYVEKYATTAKIRNIVDTFQGKLDSTSSFEKTKLQISSNEKLRDDIIKKIESIGAKINSGDEAKKFKERIEAINYDQEIKEATDEITIKAQQQITEYLNKSNIELSLEDAESIYNDFAKMAKALQSQVVIEFEDLIENQVLKGAEGLLDEYRQKLSGLTDEMNIGDIQLDPFAIMRGEIPLANTAISNATNRKKVVVGRERDERIETESFWHKIPIIGWFIPKGVSWTYKDIVEEQKYVDGRQLAEKIFAPVEEQLYKNCQVAQDYAKKEVKQIKSEFFKKFDELDKILNEKLNDLKKCAIEQEDAEKNLTQARDRLAWLEDIKKRVDAILDI